MNADGASTGATSAGAGSPQQAPGAVLALQVEHLHKSFGGLPATQDVSIEVPRGERRLLIGPNGAGKTTLFNQIAGDLLPDRGAIRLFGEDVTGLRPEQRVARGLARTYQIITLFNRDPLEHNVVLALMGRSRVRWNMSGRLRRFESLYEEARSILHSVGLRERAGQTVAEVSYGERRRLEIAMALAQRPRLLLLDEPLAGLSREERAGVRDLIAAIPREVTVVMIEHDMDIALELADQISVLHYGRLIVQGTRAEVVADPRTREVYLGH
jgi:branched-chain amino acid transport system ATP-binding protein